VDVALDLLQVLSEFNLPRQVLGLRQLPGRIGVASGPVFLGNIGTYRKMEFTAVGPAVNLAALLMRQADEKAPCISQETHELAGDRFRYRNDAPRLVELSGIGPRQVWDLAGRVAKHPSGFSLR
jgi:adenylate cyclase